MCVSSRLLTRLHLPGISCQLSQQEVIELQHFLSYWSLHLRDALSRVITTSATSLCLCLCLCLCVSYACVCVSAEVCSCFTNGIQVPALWRAEPVAILVLKEGDQMARVRPRALSRLNPHPAPSTLHDTQPGPPARPSSRGYQWIN